MAKKKASRKLEATRPLPGITQQKRDRVASILAIVVGLLAIREGGSVLFGLSVPDYQVITWFVWYNVAMGVVSVIAGAGIWIKTDWSVSLSTNVLVFHAVVCAGLIGLDRFVQTVAMTSILAMMFRTLTWTVIVSLLKWRRQPAA